jgi:hypothetical protein
MDKIQIIFHFILKTVIALTIMAVLILFIKIFFPTFGIRTILSPFSSSTSTKDDWLPAPGSFKGLLGEANTSGINGKLYVPGPAYNGYANQNNSNNSSQVDYIIYTPQGTQILHNGTLKVDTNTRFPISNTNVYAEKALYIRNLSIYEGGHIYTGLTFMGEAKSTMFQNGRFPIIIADNTGRVVYTTMAEAMSNWAIPGWTRFQVKIGGTLPNKIACTMVFQSAESYTTTQPTRVAIPILCN